MTASSTAAFAALRKQGKLLFINLNVQVQEDGKVLVEFGSYLNISIIQKLLKQFVEIGGDSMMFDTLFVTFPLS